MGNKRFIFQGFTAETHLKAVQHVLAVDDLEVALVSVAFLNFGGVKLLEEFIAPHAHNTTIFAGIRNEITSRQGLEAALDLGVSLVTVDTGSGHVLFHPKLYYARSKLEARFIIGSANLTAGGLNNNVEASVAIDLDLADAKDAALAKSVEDELGALVGKFPDHVEKVADKARLKLFQDAGRVTDESITIRPRSTSKGNDPRKDTLSRIKLLVPPVRPASVAKVKLAAVVPLAPAAPAPALAPVVPPAQVPGAPAQSTGDWELMWESNGLSARDLSIPINPQTSPTGSILLKKGQLGEEVDFRDYFRDEVFAALNWVRDPREARAHWERANAVFDVVIKSVAYGEVELLVSHNTDKQSATYVQRNGMTQIHWGTIMPFVQHEDLKNRLLRLYRDIRDRKRFMIEID